MAARMRESSGENERGNMKEKLIKVPGPDHPISIERNPARIVVSVAGRVIADTRDALTLREADYPPVHYIPREDVAVSQLERTDHTTYCPYKGDCNYYSVPAGGKRSVNAVWTYENPYPAVAQIKGHVAFYPDRVDEIAEQTPTKRESLRAVRPNQLEKTIMSKTVEEKNKAIVLEAFDTLFNRRDYAAAEKFWSSDYIQHSAHIPPGREGLFNVIKTSPPSLRYEHGLIMAAGDFVIVHGRYSNTGLRANWIVADILRIKDGILLEHWDVIQDEASKAQSKSGLPMFGSDFPN
jgi:uncharacterized protein (DUF427 family)/predicted SnoaL-like aldol condensation-catalyzing enzyme